MGVNYKIALSHQAERLLSHFLFSSLQGHGWRSSLKEIWFLMGL